MITVKALKWAEFQVKHDYGVGVCEANTPFRDHYSIWDCEENSNFKSGLWQRYYCRELSGSFDTLDEAKAAAQADYAKRVLSAINMHPDEAAS